MTTLENLSRRSHLRPTHFVNIEVEGVSLDVAAGHYFDWIKGTHYHQKKRRRQQGVPKNLDRSALLVGEGGQVSGGSGLEITFLNTQGNTTAVRFTHRDDTDSDIRWYSVARLSDLTPSSGSPRLRIEHATGRAVPPFKAVDPTTGVPTVVRKLLKLDGVRPLRPRNLASPDVMRLRRQDVAGFVKHILLDTERELPILVVSPKNETEKPIVDAESLSRDLLAQAAVALLDKDATWELPKAFAAQGFEPEFGNCYDGAVRIYYPKIRPSQSPQEHYLWLKNRLRSLESQHSNQLAADVAERAAWRALPPRFFFLIEEAEWSRNAARAEQALAVESGANKLRTELETAQQDRERMREELRELETEVHDYKELMGLAEQERDESKEALAAEQVSSLALKSRIDALEARADKISAEQRECLRKLASGEIDSLYSALHLLEVLFPDRIKILPSAWQSAEESREFKKPDKAWKLLFRLANDYWSAVQGGGDATARESFSPSTYAANESETVRGNQGALQKRTFDYQGNQLVMLKHLKIGVKDSISETWRCHFEFDPVSRLIVIGHCGRHLDFK